jgi:hypothetical protein
VKLEYGPGVAMLAAAPCFEFGMTDVARAAFSPCKNWRRIMVSMVMHSLLHHHDAAIQFYWQIRLIKQLLLIIGLFSATRI